MAAQPADTRGSNSRRTAVGADHRADLYLLPVHMQLGLGVDADAHPVAKLRPGGDCLLDEERIQPPRCVIRQMTRFDCRSILGPYRSRKRVCVILSSTTGSAENGSCRTARIVSPPPQGLSRGNCALSTK